MKYIIYLQTLKATSGELIYSIITFSIIFIIAVYITRKIFGIDTIIENQRKTNSLLEDLIKKSTEMENVNEKKSNN